MQLSNTQSVEPCGGIILKLQDILIDRPFSLGIINEQTSETGSDTKLIFDRILELAKQDLDLIVAPEYSFFDNFPFTESEKDSYLDKFKSTTAGKNMLIVPGTFIWQKDGLMYNTAYAISNGRVIHEYHKRINALEESIARDFNLTHSFGKEYGLFRWMGQNVGIEICADHGCLSNYFLLENSCQKDDMPFFPLDILLNISCGNNSPPNMICVRKGGYGILVNGEFATYTIVQK